ncbi:MAG: transcriptional regulator NrdR [Candidatus Nanoarchaeia archaeon]|nr:transcriptional regulator NrdR [Candidatus Nanoarchaeia archaeon]
MRCPYCKSEETSVVDSRDTEENAIRRRRQCEKCDKRFTSYEHIELSNLSIIKKDETRQEFDREKLKRGLLKACEKRPVSTEAIENAVNEIESTLRKKEETEVNSKIIGELVMKKLQKLDKVAYIRFASVYKEFTDVEAFQEEIKKLLSK